MSHIEQYQYLPAEGWYMTHPNTAGSSFPRTFYRVALWRISEDGTVQGLISPRLSSAHAADPVRLHTPPRCEGAQYVHIDEMADGDREHIVSYRYS